MNRTVVTTIGSPNGEQISSDPLQWWLQRATRFPILAHMAKKVLCIPATSAPVERLFSTVGNTIANDRTRLLPENAEDLIFLHNAWRNVKIFYELLKLYNNYKYIAIRQSNRSAVIRALEGCKFEPLLKHINVVGLVGNWEPTH